MKYLIGLMLIMMSVCSTAQNYDDNRFSTTNEETSSNHLNEQYGDNEQASKNNPGGPGEPPLPISDYMPLLMLVALVGIVVTVKRAQKLNHR